MRLPALTLLVLVPSTALLAQQPAAPRQWTADDILLAESPGGLAVSPDGKWLVWVKQAMTPDKGRVANLMLSGLAETGEVQLTRGFNRNTGPRWAPNGSAIAFLSSRPAIGSADVPDADLAKVQLWLIRPSGGEPEQLTTLRRDVRDFAWRDSTTILFLAEEDPGRYERGLQRAKDDSRVVDDSLHKPPVRLFSLDLSSKRITRVSMNADWMEQLSVSPDGKYAVTVNNRELSFDYDQRQFPTMWLWDLSAGTGRQLALPPRLVARLAGWAPDGTGFYLAADSTRSPRFVTASISVLKQFDLTSGKLSTVNLDWPRGLADATPNVAQPVADGVLVLLADGVKVQLARLTRTGEQWQRTTLQGPNAGNTFDFAASPDGRTVAYVSSRANQPPQVFRATVDGGQLTNTTQMSKLNPQLATKAYPQTEIVRFRGARNEEVEAILYYPMVYESGKKYPLILSIHGGPTAADLDTWADRWAYPHMLLSERGAFQLKVNYHGSSSYGLDWVESICCGHYYEYDTADLIAGLNYVFKRGLADTSRVGTMGWSNGAILSAELTTRLPWLKAASIGAGDVEWISDWGNVDFGMAFDNYYFGKAPYEDPQLYIRKSPFFRLDKVRTPTLLFFGTEDRNVPPSQGWSHYRALQQLGNTEVKFVLFPGEPHGITKLPFQRRKIAEDLAWFDRHLFDYQPAPAALKAELAREAFDSTSPLGLAIRMQGVARVAGLYGVEQGGTLVPETIVVPRRDSLGGLYPFEVGRFEVTRAQWARYDTTYIVEPGTGNYPVTDVSFESAKDYVSWLIAKTGGRWRLSTAKELAALYSSPGSGEITLDWWAGYHPTPDEAARLLERAEWMGPSALVREVGSVNPSLPQALIFDLGGNAAEWAIGGDGATGVLLGGSGDRTNDPKAPKTAPGDGYRGLRVVRDR